MSHAGWICGLLAAAFTLLVAMLWLRHLYVRAFQRHPWHWLRARLGWGRGLAELARRLEINADRLRAWTPHYREAFIPKKRGGTRRLLIPDDDLKHLQRRILRRVLAGLRVHSAACAYRRGRSIVDNALPHVGQCVVVKIDLVDFFPSCSASEVERYFRRVGWNRESAQVLARLCTIEGGLPQGAPTSPALSNLLLFAFDARLQRYTDRRKGTYTRYADDITLSFPKDYPRRMRGAIEYVRRLAKAFGFRIHRRGKLRILRPHQRQQVTGLVVNRRLNLPRKKRRQLRAIEHQQRLGLPTTLSQAQLQGWHAFAKMVESRQARAVPP